MPPLYLTQQGAIIRIKNNCLIVEAPESDDLLAKTPLGHISEVILLGNIGLTTPAIQKLLAGNIPVTFLTKGGRYFGRLSAHHTPHYPRRKTQYQLCDDQNFSLVTARSIVSAKIRHQKVILQRANQRGPQPELETTIEKLNRLEIAIESCDQIAKLRGYEGSAAAIYFQGYRQLLNEEWTFNKRQYHPSPDPINAMLSFGYTLITEAATSAVRAVGLDPYAGFLHEFVYNRPSLGLDLVEEFRPVIDGMILWLVNTQVIGLDGFSVPKKDSPNQVCSQMHDQTKRTFIRAYEDRMTKPHYHPLSERSYPLRQCLIEQARQVRQRIETNNAGYTSLGFR